MSSFSENHARREGMDRRLLLAVLLSILLHGLAVLLLILEPWTWHTQPEPPPILAEFVMPPPRPAQPAPPPMPTPPAAQALQPPPPAPAPEARRELPPLQVPNLQRNAPVTNESKAPPSAGRRARDSAQNEDRQTRPPPSTVDELGMRAPSATEQPQQRRQQGQAGNRQAGQPGASGPTGETMTQSESDFFLSQIVNAWVIDFDAPKFANIRIFGRYRVLPNGMLAPPFGKNDPWDMRAMVDGWDSIAYDRRPEAEAFRTAVETFLRAMRLAQPLRMPPNAQGYPKVLDLNFRIGDL